MKIAITILASLLLAPAALAQDLTLKAAPQSRPILIKNAVVHPITSPDISDGGILFNQGVITHILNQAQLAELEHSPDLPTNTLVIDAKRGHIYPGLIAPYTQLGLTEIQAVRQMQDTTELGDITPEASAATAINPDSTLLPVTRSNGVLLAGAFPTGGILPGRAAVIRLDGWTSEDMTVSNAGGLILRWPAMRTINAWWMDRSEGDQQQDITRSLRRITDTFDTALAYHRAKAADPSHLTDLRWEAMRPIFPADLPPVIDENAVGIDPFIRTAPEPLYVLANDIDQINAAVAFCIERGIRPVIVGGRDAPLAHDLLKGHDIPVIVNGTHVMPRRDDAPYDEPFTLPLRLHEAGILFAIANNDDAAHERNTPYSVATAVKHGLPHDAALRALTINPATILNIADRYGSLEIGKSATILLTSGDPLEVITRIDSAYIDGRLIDLSNKQSTLAQKYRERYRQMGQLKDEPE